MGAKGSGGSFRAACSQAVHVVIKPFPFGALFPKWLGEIILQCEKISDENMFRTGTKMHIVLDCFGHGLEVSLDFQLSHTE